MHQLMNEISGAPDAHARVTRNIRVPIAGERWHDDVKTVSWIAPVRAWIRQERNHLQHFRKRARPPVNENQRNRMRSRAFFVNEMKLQPSDVGTEMAECIQSGFLAPPVKLLLPERGQLAQIRATGSLAPSSTVDVFRPPSAGKSVFKVQQICFWGGDPKP